MCLLISVQTKLIIHTNFQVDNVYGSHVIRVSVVQSDDNHWMADYKGAFALMEALELSIPGVKSKKTNQVTEEGLVIPRKTGRPRIRLVFVGPKRPRRRPRKSP